MKTELTDEQVVRVLAEREGWSLALAETNNVGLYVYWVTDPDGFLDTVNYDTEQSLGTINETQQYLDSHDALAPVLATLNNDEWLKLEARIVYLQLERSQERPSLRFAITLPPAELARAIASAISKT